MTHRSYSSEELAAVGISEGLVRPSVGLKHAADLVADLDQALENQFQTAQGRLKLRSRTWIRLWRKDESVVC